jgi:fucose permease
VGGVGGAVAAATHASMTVHLVVAGVVVSVTAISISGWLMPGPDEGEREPVPGGTGAGPAGRRHPAARRFVLLGIIVVMSAAIEDAPQSWGAILLRDELGTSAAAAGSVYIAFQVSMTVARLLGDRLVDRVGEVAIVRAGGVLTAGAVAASLAIGTPTAVVVGFALAGFGTAPLFPVVFHAAGNVPGVATGYGVAFAAWMGRLGFLAAPPLVGLVGDALNLRIGLAVVPAAGVVVALLASSTAGTQPDGRSHK